MFNKFYLEDSTRTKEKETLEQDLKEIENGLRLGSFLLDSGWVEDSIKILSSVLNLVNAVEVNFDSIIIIKLDCLQRFVITLRFCLCLLFEAKKK